MKILRRSLCFAPICEYHLRTTKEYLVYALRMYQYRHCGDQVLTARYGGLYQGLSEGLRKRASQKD